MSDGIPDPLPVSGGAGKAGKEAARPGGKAKAGKRQSEEEEEEGGDTTEDMAAGEIKGGRRWRISYRWVTKNMPFFLFLAMLAVVYIYNGHYADKLVRDINRTNKELKELQYEYKTLKSEVMFRSKQSELARAVEPFGLKELSSPPVVLGDEAGPKH